ncbi:DUF3592 domain-containing protein [Gloeothece verrucosa]|uniref:DUF3592 domain-containing protein n=1 Tax=Gloeothece verrucosa (strain PCC 7822) TaxID=497965 RepID=E0UBD0_GLOV7|nr:DUF3592 domain-containing protein [Gloeothece verrucosa]ADN12762.1 conserved hypothetical protein [Gloeothece verrucosa PCC 7822]
MNQHNKLFSIVGSVFGLLGLGMLFGSWLSFSGTQDFLKNSVSSVGTVIDLRVKSSYDHDGGSIYYPRVSFQTEKAEKIDFESNFGTNPPAYKVGQQVPVLYHPDNPDQAQIKSFWSLWFVSILLLGMGGIFTVVGLSLLLSLKLQKQQSSLLAKGQQLLTHFAGVQLNTAIAVNGNHPYQIISQWLNPVTNEVHVFYSEPIWFNPEEFIESQDILVYVDSSDFNNYYMDISFLPQMARSSSLV